MNLTREQALELHRQMWSDMQEELGDNPSGDQRKLYKRQWVEEHFPDEDVHSSCFLCEYADKKSPFAVCSHCPVVWPLESVGYCCTGKLNYLTMPISQLLALPEREVEE